MSTLYYESSFAHHGVKGQKWGVRRYQNPDGTLNAAGRRHVKEWKEKQTARIYPKYNAEMYKSIVDKRSEKYAKAKLSGDSKKIDKADKKLTKATAEMYYDQGLRMYEAAKVKSMTLDDIRKEDNKVLLHAIKSAGITVGTMGLSAVTGFPLVLMSIPFPDNIRTNSRISNEERATIKAVSDEKANRAREDRLKKR